MRPKRKSSRRERAGAVLIISMIFVVVFSALAVSMATLSGNNVQLASNHQNLNAALVAAQSGQEVVRYLLSRVLIPSSTPQSQYFSEIITAVRDDLTTSGISGIAVATDGAIAAVTLDSVTGRSFDGQIQVVDANQPTVVMEVRVTGHGGQASRTITTSFDIEPYEFPIFKYGLATKGPLDFPGNPTITAVSAAWEADVFVESSGNNIAVQVDGNLNFDGDINIGNAAANVDFAGSVQIAGDIGQTAIDNHVTIGMPSPVFPTPDVDRFLQYATGDTIDSSTVLPVNGGITLTNATIEAGTNPVFVINATIKGVLFIESPNVVTFERNVALQGLIVADGDLVNPDTTVNQINILGNFASQGYPSGAEFEDISEEEGSSIVAPGFAATFAGNFSTLEGVVALSGADFTGNMSAQIKGTIINYSDTSTIVLGNASMNFDRVDSVKVPAGFDLYRELNYVPASYSEAGI